ncbi:MAG: hypothetical protein ABII80_03380 [bacterium]
MKEIQTRMQEIKEKSLPTVISSTLIGLVVLAGLKMQSLNTLSSVKDFMSDKDRVTEKCGEDLSRCTLKSDLYCDGNNTMFDFSDDVCETTPVWEIPYTGAH